MIETIKDFFSLIDVLLINIGWLFFLVALVWMIYRLKLLKNQNAYQKSTDWVFLQVKIEELSERSPLAMEQVFAALHAIHSTYTWGERLSGKIVLWISCEIVSIGGNVSYIFKVPEKFRNLLESAIFSQYPKAEVHQIDDYLGNMPHEYYPQKVDFDFFGTQMNKRKENAYPIRVFTEFEHSEQDTFIDPLSNVLEAMSNIHPHELMAYQLVARPINNDWKDGLKPLLDELKGVPKEHGFSFFDVLIHIPRVFMDIIVRDLMGIDPEEETHKSKAMVKEQPPTLMMHRSDVEKMIIASIENGLSKISFEVRVRLLYLAPKEKFNKTLRVPEIIGAFRGFDDVNLNGLKPDTHHTWTDVRFHIKESWEKSLMKHRSLVRKRHMWHNFLGRKIWQGSSHTILNTQELATIFHFPVSPNVRVSQVERVSAVKAAPPSDLPVG